MSASYSVGVFRKPGDEARKEQQYKDFLKLQAKISTEEEKANKEYLLNEQLDIKPLPQKQLSFQEKQQNAVIQRQLAQKNLYELMDREEANITLGEMNDATILFFNNNFNDIKNQLKGRVVGHLFMRQFLQDYLLRFGLTNNTGISFDQVGTERILANIQDMLSKAFQQAGINGIDGNDDGDDGDDFSQLQRNLLQRLASFDRKQLSEFQAELERLTRAATTIQRTRRGQVGRRRALTRAQERFREEHERAIQEIMEELEAQRLANEQLGMAEEDIDSTVREIREDALRRAFEGRDRRMARNVLERLQENVEEQQQEDPFRELNPFRSLDLSRGLDFVALNQLADRIQSGQFKPSEPIIPESLGSYGQDDDRETEVLSTEESIQRLSDIPTEVIRTPSRPRLTPGQRFMMPSSQIRAIEGEEEGEYFREPTFREVQQQRGMVNDYLNLSRLGSLSPQEQRQMEDVSQRIIEFYNQNEGRFELLPELVQIVNEALQPSPILQRQGIRDPSMTSQMMSEEQGREIQRNFDIAMEARSLQTEEKKSEEPSFLQRFVQAERERRLRQEQEAGRRLIRSREQLEGDVIRLRDEIANLGADLNQQRRYLGMATNQQGKENQQRIITTIQVEIGRKERLLKETQAEIQRRFGAGLGGSLYLNRKNKSYNKYSRMIRSGRGLTQGDDQDRYRIFGKYILHLPSLYNGILNIKHKSLTRVQTIPRIKITQECVDFLDDLLSTQHFNKREFQRLSEDEQNLLVDCFVKANLHNKLGIRVRIPADRDIDIDEFSRGHKPVQKKLEDDLKRFELVQGELIAGNNNPAIIKELKMYVEKFMKNGVLDEGQGLDLLKSIEIVV